MQLLYDARRFARDTIETAAARLVKVLAEMPSRGGAPVGRLVDELVDAHRRDASLQATAFQNAARERLRKRTRERLQPGAGDR
jgi:hypothetical protein